MRRRFVVISCAVFLVGLIILAISWNSLFPVYMNSGPGPSTSIDIASASCSGNPESCTLNITFQLYRGGDGDGNSFVLAPACDLVFGGADHNGTAVEGMHNSTFVVATCTADNESASAGSLVWGTIYQQFINAREAMTFNKPNGTVS